MHWRFSGLDGEAFEVVGPREFRHTFSTVINGLIQSGFTILRFSEDVGENSDAEPGSWEHFTRIVPPWITFVTRYDSRVTDREGIA